MATQVDNMLVRVQSIKTYDDKEQQQLEAWGRHNERYGGTTGKNAVPRVQHYSLTNHPPNGSQGVTLNLNGNPDNSMMIGMEHPQYRPKNLAEGEFKLYEMWGGYLWGRPGVWICNRKIQMPEVQLALSEARKERQDGDIWFDGKGFKARIGGRTKRLVVTDADDD